MKFQPENFAERTRLGFVGLRLLSKPVGRVRDIREVSSKAEIVGIRWEKMLLVGGKNVEKMLHSMVRFVQILSLNVGTQGSNVRGSH